MKARIFITVLLIIVIVSTFNLAPSNAFADDPYANPSSQNSVFDTLFSGNFSVMEIFVSGVKYILIYDGIQLIYSYPEE